MKKKRNVNPFKAVAPLDLDKIWEKAISRASKVSIPKIKKDALTRRKILILNKIETLRQILNSALNNFLGSFPNIAHLHPFYRSAIEIYAELDKVKLSLGRISGTIRTIDRLTEQYKKYVRATKEHPYWTEKQFIRHIEGLWKQYVARTHSIIKRISDAVDYINRLLKRLRKLPDYDPELPTIVVAGPPNSGKSSLVGTLSNAKVQIASYPFTTKHLVFGIILLDPLKNAYAQIVDSPGLFDRPIKDRKPEELLALNAVKTISDILIFLFDGSQIATLSPQEQLNIFRELLEFLKDRNTKVIAAINKIDIEDPDITKSILAGLQEMSFAPIKISVKENIGLDSLMDKIKQVLR